MKSPRTFWLCLAVVLVLFVAQGAWFATRMVTWTDESAYVHLGYLVATGQISLFQDEMTGSRVPLPFWVLGLSQVVWGRSLLAARLVSLALAAVALVLTALVARRCRRDSDNLAGVMAAVFLASQGVIVCYLATATYHALAGTLLLSGLLLMMSDRQPSGRVAGMAVLSILFLVRTNLWPILPAAFVLAIYQSRDRRERVLLTGAAALVPVLFFLSDSRHMKLLLYVPGVNRVPGLLPYPNPWRLIEVPQPTLAERIGGVARFGRTYEFWILALAFLVVLILIRRVRGMPARTFFESSWVRIIAGLAIYLAIWQIFILRDYPRAFIAWFPSWAPLVAIVLGVEFTTVLTQRDWGPPARAVIATILAALVVLPMAIVRHPLLPMERDARPLHDLSASAAHFGRLVPAGSKVFLWGDSLPLYLAGVTPYLRQIHSANTLALREDRVAIEKSGLWGERELETWLGRDADYAVVEQLILDYYGPRAPAQVARITTLLQTHFERLDRVQDYPWFVYDVYRRRPRS